MSWFDSVIQVLELQWDKISTCTFADVKLRLSLCNEVHKSDVMEKIENVIPIENSVCVYNT